jgi:hypothetical protein
MVRAVDVVTSADGTPIAYERRGSGPAVVMVGGGLDDGAENEPLAVELAAWFTTYNYARRGRAGSGDTPPYAVAREVEDLAAVVGAAGGTASLFGASSGGALALEAAAGGLPVDRVAVYEVPYLVGEELQAAWRGYVELLGAALAEGRRGDALELFMRLAGSSEADIAGARGSPVWPGLEELAPTLAHDAAVLGDGAPPVARLGRLAQPVLVLTGSGLAGLPGFFDSAADALVAAIPGARRDVVRTAGHVPEPAALVPVLTGFFRPAAGGAGGDAHS